MLLHEALELGEFAMVANVETEGHGRVDLRVVDLFGRLLVEADVALFDLVEVVGYGGERVVGVKEDEAVLLHADKVVGFFRPTADDATVKLLHEEGLDWAEVLRADLLQTESGRDEDQDTVPPVSLQIELRCATFRLLLLLLLVSANPDILVAEKATCVHRVRFWHILALAGRRLLYLGWLVLATVPVIVLLLAEKG